MNKQKTLDYTFLVDNITIESVFAELLMKLDGFVSIELAEKLTTLDKTTQYRERNKGKFPQLVTISSMGRRKGYRIQDLHEWIKNPAEYRSRIIKSNAK